MALRPTRRVTPSSTRVAVIGAGHVGLPTTAALTTLGHTVCCAEADPERLRTLQRGAVPIYEEGLLEALSAARRSGRLTYVGKASTAVLDAAFVFLCVPTPELPDGSADLSYLTEAASEIGPHLSPGAIIVNKSTVPVGSTRLVEQTVARRDVTVVSNPEFLREGTAVQDSLRPDRIVVGADDQDAAARVGALFRETGAPLLVTDARTAETIKYVANTFLATKLSFMNAVAGLCDSLGADVRDVVLGIGYDRRIGFDFLRPGPGWGGSCLPKDTQALLQTAREAEYDFPLLRAAIETNGRQGPRVVDKLESALRQELRVDGAAPVLEGATIGVWGLTFKAGTDDLRESPALRIVQLLVAADATVRAYDPTLRLRDDPPGVPSTLAREWASLGFADRLLDRIAVVASQASACEAASGLLVLTEWEEFRTVDFRSIRERLSLPIVVDARNVLDPGAARAAGLRYVGIGRP